MRCVKCGSELKPGAKFCSKCGAVNGPAGGGRKQPPGKIQPTSNGYRPSPGGQGGYPPPVSQKEKKPTALIAVLVVLVLCLVLSVGGLAAYKMGVFDSLLPGSRTEETSSKKDKREQDEEEDDQDWDEEEEGEEDEDGNRDREEAGSQDSTDTAESSPVSEEPATLPTMDPTMAATQAPTMAQTTAAMPTLAGQGAPAQGGVPAGGNQDYILPDSSTRSLTYADISGLTKEQLRIARNEIYARHGRMFTTEELQNYFNSKSWYRGTISASSFSESMLSQLEKDNIKLIQERENALP